MSSLLITCQSKSAVERHIVPAVRLGGWSGEIHLATPGAAEPDLEGVAGLLVPGGHGIRQRRWNGGPEAEPAATEATRDALEVPLVRRAWSLGLPILGICRGEQVLNVALGGNLLRDIPTDCGLDASLHRRGTADQADEAHAVTIAPDSRLAALVGGTEAMVNSRHHRAVLRVAPPLRAVAWCRHPDRDLELVEAVEAPEPDHWVLGVQWHPENLVHLPNGTGRAALAIFQGFAAALAGRA